MREMPGNVCMLRLHESMHEIYWNLRKAHARWTGERMNRSVTLTPPSKYFLCAPRHQTRALDQQHAKRQRSCLVFHGGFITIMF